MGIGASSKAGSLILAEAVERGHEVAALVRDKAKIQEQNVEVIEKNIFDITADDFNKFDVIDNAAPKEEHKHIDAGRVLNDALKNATNIKLVVVGRAGSLYVMKKKRSRIHQTFLLRFFPRLLTWVKLWRNYRIHQVSR